MSLRLAIVTTEYPPYTADTGGIGTFYAGLAPKLAELGQEVQVFAPGRSGRGVEEREGVRIHLQRRVSHAAWTFAAARAVRRNGRFDLVWAPEWMGSAWAYSRRRDCGPLVTHLFTSLAQVADLWEEWPRTVPRWRGLPGSVRDRVQSRVQNSLEKGQAERSDAIVAQTRAILDWSRRLWDIAELPVRVLPSVLDVPAIRAFAGEASAGMLPEASPRVVFFGRLDSHKGADTLVEAMGEVWPRFPEAALVLLGDGQPHEVQRLREIAGANAARLHLLGYRSGAALFSAVAAADVVALPSRWENFAHAALEAMALRRPVVLSSAGGASEFCRDGVDSLLVPPRDPEALATSITRLLESADLRERLGREAATTAERFDVAAVAPRYLAYFEELVASG